MSASAELTVLTRAVLRERTAGRRLRRALLLAGVSALPLVCVGSATALTRKGADAIAMRLLSPAHEKGPVALFGLPRALPRGSVVSEGGVEGRVPGGPVRLPGKVLQHPAYLFWLDESYGAEFEHPSTLLLLDARSGHVSWRRRMLWPPLIGKRLAPFVATRAAYSSHRYQLFARAPDYGRIRTARGAALGDLGSPAFAHAAAPALPAGYFAKDCMVMIGDRGSPTFEGSFTAMLRWANSVSLQSSYAVDIAELGSEVTSFTKSGCSDVFIYVAGHGLPKPGFTRNGKTYPGDPLAGVALGARYTLDASGHFVKLDEEILRESDLDAILKAHPKIEFKMKIDSCFAGRFAGLTGKNPNLRVLELSSSEDQPSQGYLKDATVTTSDGKVNSWAEVADNQTGATEFTNGDVHGLAAWADSATQIAQNPGLAGAIQASLTLGMTYNGSASADPTSAEFTTPSVMTNQPLPTNNGSTGTGTTGTGSGGSPLGASIQSPVGNGTFLDGPLGGSQTAALSFQGQITGGTPPYTATINWGDGASGTGTSASHPYPAAKSLDDGKSQFTLTFTARDSTGATSPASTVITVLCNGISHAGFAADLGAGSAPTIVFCGHWTGGFVPASVWYMPASGQAWQFSGAFNIFENHQNCPNPTGILIGGCAPKDTNDDPTLAWGGAFNISSPVISGMKITVNGENSQGQVVQSFTGSVT